jgi:hypothetical protein
MGKKVRVRKISIMRNFRKLTLSLVMVLATVDPSPCLARMRDLDLTVQAEYRLMLEKFTTEKVSRLDSYQTFPHRQRWILSRHVEITGLKAFPKPNNKFGVKAEGIVSVAQGYTRGPGPWYQSLKDFNCEKKPNPMFETAEGAERAATAAGNYWSDLLEREKLKLSFLLQRVAEKTEAAALDQGDQVFRKWLRALYPLWRAEVEQKGRQEEWNSYLAEASAEKICARKTAAPLSNLEWRSMMEPPAALPPPVTKLLARAPARLWDGLYSVRLSIGAAGKTLNGRFLIDPAAKESVISPAWLESQGVFPLWVVVPNEPPARVTWSGEWAGNGSLVPVANIESVSLSGLSLPLNRFLLKDTEFFTPPDYLASCCDGVLGLDFLKLFPTEFQSSSPAEVKVWPIENYRGPIDSKWVEVGEIKTQDLPARGDFIYDLPHGRIWFPASTNQKQTPKVNQSGLELEYSLIKGERILRVKRIHPRSKASRQLFKSGIKIGTQITQIDSKPVEEIDITEVNQRLAGHYGEVVSLQWKAGKGLKMAPLYLSAKPVSPSGR